MNDQPIVDNDFAFIDSMLEKYASKRSMISVSELEGFLTAIISGPDMILPSEWLPAIWGGEEYAPEWQSEEEFSRFMAITMGLMNSNVDTLMENPEDYTALFLVGDTNGENQEQEEMLVTPWCIGYMRAVSMRHESWLELPPDMQEYLTTIALFASDAGEEILEKFSADEITQLQQSIDPAARALHAHWLIQREEALLHQLQPHPQAPHIAEPKTGRNAPCPCGSGKKHKKCCLH